MYKFKSQQVGLTLIESIVDSVILGFALSVLVSGVFGSSSKSHQATYQVQAATLGHSIITDILSRQFDEHSDPNGGAYRCGEAIAPESCTASNDLGRDGSVEQNTMSRSAIFNDVDDFIGCWGESAHCSSNILTNYPLNKLIDEQRSSGYKNFTVQIQVTYSDIDGNNPASVPYKKIEVILYASNYATYAFHAYKGNY